jgi:hypothetical protein
VSLPAEIVPKNRRSLAAKELGAGNTVAYYAQGRGSSAANSLPKLTGLRTAGANCVGEPRAHCPEYPMVAIFVPSGSALKKSDAIDLSALPDNAVWIDLDKPTTEEDRSVERFYGI